MAKDLVPSGGEDGSLVVGVDSRQAMAGLNTLEARVYGFVNNTQNAFNRFNTGKFANQVNSLNTMFKKLAVTIGSYMALRQVFHMVEGFLERMVSVNRVFTGFIASMSIIKGSVSNATKEYQFLLSISNKLGVSVEASITQYHRLAAALKNVDSTGELTRHIFSGISQAAVVLHSRGRDITLIFEAVQQMASKGKLSLEELQRQLGNTLPGAIGIAARAMMKSEDFVKAGVKNAAEAEQMLRKGIEKGTINVYEFLARLSDQLKQEYGAGVKYASDQFTANMNRMKNATFEFYRMAGSSSAMDGLTRIVKEFTGLLNDANGQGAAGLGQALANIFEGIANWLASITPADITEFFETIQVAIKSTGIVVSEFTGLFSGIGGTEMQTPLLDFVEFCAKTMAALVDIFRVAIAGIETAIRGIGHIFYAAREGIMGFSDNLADGLSFVPGVSDSAAMKDYRRRREEQRSTYNSNAGALDSASNMFLYGPQQNAYDKVGAAFGAARSKIYAGRLGIDGAFQFGMPYVPGAGGVDSKTGLPSWMAPTKAGSTADAAAAYVNPLGDYKLQQLIDDIRTNSNAPNAPKDPKGKKDPVQSNFLREQTRLLKGIAVAENEYQNILTGRNRIEGENEAQMRSLISTDERYIKLSDTKKAQLVGWAKQLDELNLKVLNAVKAQDEWNSALQAGYEVQDRLSELEATGYMSKYREERNVRNSFKAGGENEFMDQENQRKMLEAAMKKDNDQRILDMAEYAAQIRLSNDELRFQSSLLGMSRLEQQKAIEFRKIDLQIAQMSVGATQEQILEYQRMADVLKNDVGSALDELNAKQNDLWGGIQRGLQSFIDGNSDWAGQMEDITVRALGGIEDAFVSMVETGKLSFKDLTRSIAKDLMRLIVRYLLVWFLQKMTGLAGSSSSGGQGSMEGFGNNVDSMFSVEGGSWSGFMGGSAKGNVFQSGRMKYFAKGGVFDQPTVFPLQNGFGTAFEKGPEAIMPLAKDKSGNLGVSIADSDLGGGDSVLNLTVEVYQGKGDGVKTEQTQSDKGDVLKIFIGEVAADIQRGGQVAKSIQSTYGLRKSSKSYV